MTNDKPDDFVLEGNIERKNSFPAANRLCFGVRAVLGCLSVLVPRLHHVLSYRLISVALLA